MSDYLLDRAVWTFGNFVEGETQRYQYASKPGGKKGETIKPSEEEVAEFRRALIEQTPFSKRNARKRKPVRKLSELVRSQRGGRRIVREPGKETRSEL